MPVVAAQTFEDGDGLHLLLYEDPSHARNTDPAQDQDHQSGEAQLSFHALQYLIREILHAAERPQPVRPFRLEIALQFLQQRLILPLARFEKFRIPQKTAEAGKSSPGRVRVVHHRAWKWSEIDPIARRLLDRPAHSESQPAEVDLITDLEVELRHQNGRQEYASPF